MEYLYLSHVYIDGLHDYIMPNFSFKIMTATNNCFAVISN